MWSEKFAQLAVDVLVGDYEGCFVAVDNQPSFCQVVTQLVPSLDGALCQVLGVCVTAVKANVIDPSIQAQVRICLLETGEDGLEKGLGKEWSLWTPCRDSRGGMEPGTEFPLGQNGLVPGVHLHGEL